MTRKFITAVAATALSAGAYAADAPVATQWGTVSEPALPSAVCGTPLTATITPVNGSVDAVDGNPANSQPDAQRIQAAIDACPAGQAVKLVMGSYGESGFLSGPLKLKTGVTLWIDKGVTLFASRNPADYDNGVGTCGTATPAKTKSCNPLITVRNTANSGIVGDGSIDGRGGSLVTSGPNAGHRSWWDIAYQNKSSGGKLNQQNPRLIGVFNSSAFTLYHVTVQNSPNFHIVTTNTNGVTAWGIKIVTPSLAYSVPGYKCAAGTTPDQATPATCFTPETVKNTDGFDPGQSANVLLAYSYISTGDDHVAVKSSSGPTGNLTFAHNHFYYGHGMSIGSETNTGVSNVAVTDMTIDGYGASYGGGLRIKSDASVGGPVNNVTYDGVCMRNVTFPLVFDPYYSKASKGTEYPDFTNIVVRNFRDTGNANGAVSELTFLGYEKHKQKNPLTITLDNVVFDGAQPAFQGAHSGGPASPADVHFTFGGGQVSFADSIVTSSSNDVTKTGTPGTSTPRDCSAAFVPLKSVAPSSPI